LKNKQNNNSFSLRIADFIIRIQTGDSTPIALEDSYLPFSIDENPENIELNIETFAQVPPEILPRTKPIFTAENENGSYFSVYQTQNNIQVVVYNQHLKNHVQQILMFDESLKTAKIFTAVSDISAHYFPLVYPTGPLLLYYLTLTQEAVMIHASGVFDGNKGRLFTGFSGRGKSTMASIWKNAGHQIINDDRILIRKLQDGYYMYNTPMPYADIPKKSRIDEIYLISHAMQNHCAQKSGAIALAQVMAFCIQQSFSAEHLNHLLEFLTGLSQEIRIFELGFVPNEQIIPFITANENY
jgi:hypothetical protein